MIKKRNLGTEGILFVFGLQGRLVWVVFLSFLRLRQANSINASKIRRSSIIRKDSATLYRFVSCSQLAVSVMGLFITTVWMFPVPV